MQILRVLGNIVILLLAVVGGVVLALPVIEDMNDGRANAAFGAGPASAAMVYVLLTPILCSLARGLLGRLGMLGLTLVAALVTRTWVGLIEGGRIDAALLVMAGAIVALVCAALVMRTVARQRREEVSALARVHATMAGEVAQHLRRRFAASSQNTRMEGPLHQSGLVEQLVFGLIAEAATSDDVDEYACAMLTGLAEIGEALSNNTRTDPSGYGALAVGEYLARLRGDLRRRLPGARPAVVARPSAPRAA